MPLGIPVAALPYLFPLPFPSLPYLSPLPFPSLPYLFPPSQTKPMPPRIAPNKQSEAGFLPSGGDYTDDIDDDITTYLKHIN